MSAVGVAILGSTGSIGRTTLRVIRAFPDRLRVVALTANRRGDLLRSQVEAWRPDLAVLADGELSVGAAAGTRIGLGRDGVLEAATHPEAQIVVNGLVGAAGLEPTLAALEAGRRVALANKESLVVAGELVMRTLDRGRGELIPVDSEHSAIFQCLQGESRDAVRRLVLTASGGAFRDLSRSELSGITPEAALRHPTWEMGAKVTVDSATLVNKALEVIEAHHLFGVPYQRIEVLIHRQSIVHSLVECLDGSVLAQLGQPTMTVPILYALSYPERLPFEPPHLDLTEVGSLSFEPVPAGRFPAFDLGRAAAHAGGTAPAAFNAGNEEAVGAFLEGRLPFGRIPDVIERTLQVHEPEEAGDLEVVLTADRRARDVARSAVREMKEERTGRLS